MPAFAGPRQDPLALTLCVAALAVYAWLILRSGFQVDGTTWYTLIDDAMISMRYAQHLAAGHGLVWNVGEPPIQGFSNPLWTLWFALLHLLLPAGAQVPLAVMASAALLLVVAGLTLRGLVLELAPSARPAALLALFLLLAHYPLVFWSLRGMESALAALLALQAARATLQVDTRHGEAVQAGLYMTAMLALRIDLAAQVGVLVGWLAWRRGALARPTLTAALPPAALLLVLLTWQAWYFGSALPNTYHLKMDGVTAAARIEVGLAVLPYAARELLPLGALIAAALWRCPACREPRMALLIALGVVQVLYSLYVGGDYAEPRTVSQVGGANRFITQGLPFLLAASALALTALDRGAAGRARNLRHVAAALVLLVLMHGHTWPRWLAANAALLDTDIWRARLGLHLARHTAQGAVIAVHAAGQIPYYSARRAIDLLGKSDAHVARVAPVAPFRPGHNKWDYAYSIGRLQPDVVADEWGASRAWLAERSDYLRLANGIHVRRDSDTAPRADLARAYR